jgi:membrane-associated phospholipid phosphatase
LMARYYGLRRTTRALAVYLALIIVSTIYFGWHYVTDDIAGVLIALTAVQLGKWTVFPPRSLSLSRREPT